MDDEIPPEARPAARVLLIGPDQQLLLLLAEEEDGGGHQWWVTPGGGLEDGESFEQAAHRELHEETGLSLRIDRPTYQTRFLHSAAPMVDVV